MRDHDDGTALALELLVQHLEDDVARPIIGEAATAPAIGAESAAIEPSFLVTIERNTHPVEPDDFPRRLFGEALHHRPLAQPISRGEDVLGKSLWRVVLSQRGVNPSLGDG